MKTVVELPQGDGYVFADPAQVRQLAGEPSGELAIQAAAARGDALSYTSGVFAGDALLCHLIVDEAPPPSLNLRAAGSVRDALLNIPEGGLVAIPVHELKAGPPSEPQVTLPAGHYRVNAGEVDWSGNSTTRDDQITDQLPTSDADLFRKLKKTSDFSFCAAGCLTPLSLVVGALLCLVVFDSWKPLGTVAGATAAGLFALWAYHWLRWHTAAARRVVRAREEIEQNCPHIVIQLERLADQPASGEFVPGRFGSVPDELNTINLWDFDGRSVVDFGGELATTRDIAWRLSLAHGDDGPLEKRVDDFCATAGAGDVSHLVIGMWTPGESPDPVVQALVRNRAQLAGLRALMIGDMTSEECEISWIIQGDLQPLFGAFPDLRVLRIRGGGGLELGTVRHEALETLIIETGGLDRQTIRQVAGAQLPSLTHLELWLGEENYGFDGTADDIRPLLREDRFPRLQYLGLRNSDITDEIVQVLQETGLPPGLKVLDLSMGTLSDSGAAALLQVPGLDTLQALDLRHHFLGQRGMDTLAKLDIRVDLSCPLEPVDGHLRYVAVGE